MHLFLRARRGGLSRLGIKTGKLADMSAKNPAPILEFDNNRDAVISPRRCVPEVKNFPVHCVLCFFRDAVGYYRRKNKLKRLCTLTTENGPRGVYEFKRGGRRLAFFHVPVGAPAATGHLEELVALGAKKFIACGGAGVLDRDIAVGHLMVPYSAVRDEGTSYHYLPPGREVAAHPDAVAAIKEMLDDRGLPCRVAKTWTTDAPFRETTGKVARRKKEGCLTVEMEAAALFAVAQFRGVKLGMILYGGDDVSGADWDHRGWEKKVSVRRQLPLLAIEACLKL
jgi:uridine phosphorylase